jgi:hypothetical protein
VSGRYLAKYLGEIDAKTANLGFGGQPTFRILLNYTKDCHDFCRPGIDAAVRLTGWTAQTTQRSFAYSLVLISCIGRIVSLMRGSEAEC